MESVRHLWFSNRRHADLFFKQEFSGDYIELEIANKNIVVCEKTARNMIESPTPTVLNSL